MSSVCKTLDCYDNKGINNNPYLYYSKDIATKFKLVYPGPGHKRYMKELWC